MFKAYLLVTLSTRGPFPTVKRVSISDHPVEETALMDGECHAELAFGEGFSKEDARKSVRKYALENDHLKWTKLWIEGSNESESALRYLWQK